MYKLYEQILLQIVKKIVCQYINQNHMLWKLQLAFCLTFYASFYFEVLFWLLLDNHSEIPERAENRVTSLTYDHIALTFGIQKLRFQKRAFLT